MQNEGSMNTNDYHFRIRVVCELNAVSICSVSDVVYSLMLSGSHDVRRRNSTASAIFQHFHFLTISVSVILAGSML